MANINLNTSPYYDDFDEDKKFLKILFRPGYSVQARELTQLQSILQKQVDRFGQHMFKEGAMIMPGEVSYDASHHYVKLYDINTDGDPVIPDWVLTGTLRCEETGVEARVTDYIPAENTDPITIYVQYTRGGEDLDSNAINTFRAGDELVVISNENASEYIGKTCKVKELVDDASPIGLGTAAYISEGVYFVQGFFVKVDEQKIFLEKYQSTGISWRVGLKAIQSIVTEKDDLSLLSNASGAPNYAAPGAHRFRIELLLDKIEVQPEEEPRQPAPIHPIDESDPLTSPEWVKDFIELLVIKDDVVYKQVRYTEYNIIEKTLARRTYDESGDYTVRPFSIKLKNYLDNGVNNGIYQRSLSLDLDEFTVDYQIQEGDQIKQTNDPTIVGTVTLYNPSTGRVFYILENENYKFVDDSDPNVQTNVTIYHYDGSSWVEMCKTEIVKGGVYGNDYDQLLGIVTSPGKAYVRGHEIERIAKDVVALDRQLKFGVVDDIDAAVPHGNAIYVKNLSGSLPLIHKFQKADIYDNIVAVKDAVAITGSVTTPDTIFTRSGTWDPTLVDEKYVWSYISPTRTVGKWSKISSATSNTITVYGNTPLLTGATRVEIYDAPCDILRTPVKIGECRIKFIQYDTGGINVNADATEANAYGKFFLHIFDVTTKPGYNFENAQSIYTTDGFKCDIITDLYRLNGVITGSHSASDKPDSQTVHALTGSQECRFLKDLEVNNILIIRPSADRVKILITSISDDYHASYKLIGPLTTGSGDTPLISKDECYAQFANLSAPETNQLVYRLPHANIKRLQKVSNETPLLDVSFSTLRTFVDIGTSGTPPSYTATITCNTGEKFSIDDEDYLLYNNTLEKFVDVTSLTFNDPYNPTQAIIGVGNNPGTYSILARIARSGNISTQYKTKNKISNYSIEMTDAITLGQDSINLGVLDVFKLRNVYMATSIGGSYNPVGAVDITERYILDSGQKDNYYDYAKIIRKRNAPLPTGNLKIVFDYFEHTDGVSSQKTYYCVNSYVNAYDDIPTFISSTGTRYDLRDCVDFRPDVTSLDDAGSFIELQVPSWNFRTDYEFYFNRIDKLVLTDTGVFEIVKGEPDIEPSEPITPPNAMVLYKFYVPAYTSDPTDIDVEFVENKRYTMRDIGKLEKRIENLEYYTTLALLEKETADMNVRDPETGLNRFQLGFIVDPFNVSPSDEASVGDIASPDFRCSINIEESLCRPQFDQKLIQFKKSSLLDAVQTGDVITLPYTSEKFIEQPYATYFEWVNPYNISVYRGVMKLDPPYDEWKETKYLDVERIEIEGNYKSLEQMVKQQGIIWNDWETKWSGWSKWSQAKKHGEGKQIGWVLKNHEEVYYSQLHFDNKGNPLPIDKLPAEERKKIEKLREAVEKSHPKKKILEQRWTRTRTGSLSTFKRGVQGSVQERWDEEPAGIDRVVSVEYIDHMRPRLIQFTGKRFKPNTKLYAFFDDKPVSKYCCTTEAQYGGNIAALKTDSITQIRYVATPTTLQTNESGDIVGYFDLPHTDTIYFETGQKRFRLTSCVDDKPATDERPSYADAFYEASGFVETKQQTIIAVRNADVIYTAVEDADSAVIEDKDSWTRQVHGDWIDPIAQTFFVDSEGGAFITKVDIFFKKKPTTTNTPIELQIREITGDQRPDPVRCLPFSKVLKYPNNTPNEISISDDATVATTFTFESPVYLMDKTVYAICLISESDDYEVYVANKQTPTPDMPDNEIKNIILTPIEKKGDLYSSSQFKQYMGVFFRSQNGGTWNDDQYVDLKFTIYKAKFDTSKNGVADFVDGVASDSSQYWEKLPPNCFKIKSGSRYMRVRHPNHGLRTSDTVSLRITPDTSDLQYWDGIIGHGTATIPPNDLTGLDIVSAQTDYYVVATKDAGMKWSLSGHPEYSGFVNDANARGTRNLRYDLARLMVGEVNFGSFTKTRYQFSSTPYTLDSFEGRKLIGDIPPNENFDFGDLRGTQIIYNKEVRESHSLTHSSEFNVYLNSTNPNLSPVIDTKRFSQILINNRVDRPTVNDNYTGVDDIVVFPGTYSGSKTLTYYTADNSFIITGITDPSVVEQLYNILSVGKYINISGSAPLDRVMILNKEFTDTGDLKIYLKSVPTASPMTTFTITLWDYHVDEIAPENGSSVAKYVTRVMPLANSATMLKIYFAAYNNKYSEFKTYYKVLTQDDDRNIFTEIPYTLIESDNIPEPCKSPNQTVEYRYTIDFSKMDPTPTPFVAAICKVVMTYKEDQEAINDIRVSCDPPKILDFRMIALE